jgi:serine/threonine-protein phosphatase PP1 catalytic subunit
VSSVLGLASPIHVCGDIHGHFSDLTRVFQSTQFSPGTKYLFPDKYEGRGYQSLEVICVLFVMKLRYPRSIFLLHGNYESPEMTEAFGFDDE